MGVSRGFLIKTMLKIFVIFAACVVVSFSFSCEPCKKSTCQRPSYCKSGAYVKDPCQCCDECARAKNEECGGPWDIYGRCAPGLTCQASNSGNNFQTFDGYSDNPGKCVRRGSQSKPQPQQRPPFFWDTFYDLQLCDILCLENVSNNH